MATWWMRLALVAVVPLAGCDSGDGATAGDVAGAPDVAADAGTSDDGASDDGKGAADSAAPDVADAAGDGGADGAGDAGADAAPAPKGCDGASLLPLPPYAERGPWDVGVRTVVVDDLVTEVWYPAPPGSGAGLPPVVYDLRDALPPEEQGKIPNDHAPVLPCDCVRDLALDTAHGPYPVVAFVHGTAAFRTQSVSQMTHWASRGFVVVSSDHPHLKLADVLKNDIGADLPGDVGTVLDALSAPAGDLAFLDGHLATDRVGLAGHSAGGGGIKTLGARPGVRVVMPMAAGGVDAAPTPVSTVIFGGLEDGIVPFSEQQKGFDTESAPPKRLIGLAKAGHLAFSDICAIAADEGGLVDLALAYGVNIPQPELFKLLATDGCKPGQLTPDEVRPVLNDATAAALEEALHCDAEATAALTGLRYRHVSAEVYEEDLAGAPAGP